MNDLDPKSPEANVLRKMATGGEIDSNDFTDELNWFSSKREQERALKGVLTRLKAGGYVKSKEMRPCTNYRSHHMEWSITVKGMEMVTVLEVMES